MIRNLLVGRLSESHLLRLVLAVIIIVIVIFVIIIPIVVTIRRIIDSFVDLRLFLFFSIIIGCFKNYSVLIAHLLLFDRSIMLLIGSSAASSKAAPLLFLLSLLLLQLLLLSIATLLLQ